jgi:hypothetical protein
LFFLFLWRTSLSFDNDHIGSVDCFWYYNHFHNINSADPWAWDFFPFSVVFFFLQCFIVFIVYYFKFILRYLIFWGYCKGDCFSDLFLTLLLAYREATDFCMLILYSATSLDMFVRSKSFLVEFLGSLKHKIISGTNRDNLSSSFPVCIPFIFFLLPSCSG